MKSALLALLLGTAIAAHAAAPVSQSEAATFFKRMGELNNSFDEKYIDLYADDAVITGHKHASGETQTLSGTQWRQLMSLTWSKIKKRDDRSTFSKTHFEAQGERMKIRAERYAVRKCNTDPDYYLVLGRQADGRILIVEESFELSVPNLCK